MNIEEVRNYCLSLPLATEDFPFDTAPWALAFRVMDKIFAMLNVDNPAEWFVLKCDPEYAIELREHYTDIVPAWHMNKRHWNEVNLMGSLPDQLIKSLIDHSYIQVVSKLPGKIRKEHPELNIQ